MELYRMEANGLKDVLLNISFEYEFLNFLKKPH
uniref:Uncharacterized protein n=1 Tax=Ascaris lumbricoides TaxID=6252 RepID=A0A0M3IVN8_ASCLU